MRDMIPDSECMTVVVPVRNRPGLILRCLDSIYAQTYRPLRVLVVDNASTDDTPRVVEEWAKIHVGPGFSLELLHDPRIGAAYARQTGLDHTVTDKVMFFDSDDTMRPECVASAMAAFASDSSAMIVAWRCAVHSQNGVGITHDAGRDVLVRHLVHAVLRTIGYAIRTEWIRKCGGWRGQFPNWNDFETGTRLLLPDPKLVALDMTLTDIYPQKESITGTSFSENAGKWELALAGIEENIKKSGRSDAERLLNIVGYRRVILAAHYAREGRMDLALPLYRSVLEGASARCRLLYRFSWLWTKVHLRGAFSIVGRFL